MFIFNVSILVTGVMVFTPYVYYMYSLLFFLLDIIEFLFLRKQFLTSHSNHSVNIS